jgi:hypothetical protein
MQIRNGLHKHGKFNPRTGQYFEPEIRNPNPRRPKEGRNPKSEMGFEKMRVKSRAAHDSAFKHVRMRG